MCVNKKGKQVCQRKNPIVIDTLSPIILRNWSLKKDIRIQVFIIGTSSFPIQFRVKYVLKVSDVFSKKSENNMIAKSSKVLFMPVQIQTMFTIISSTLTSTSDQHAFVLMLLLFLFHARPMHELTYPSGAPELIPYFYLGSCCPIFSFLCHVLQIIACSFVLFLLVIALSVNLRFMPLISPLAQKRVVRTKFDIYVLLCRFIFGS